MRAGRARCLVLSQSGRRRPRYFNCAFCRRHVGRKGGSELGFVERQETILRRKDRGQRYPSGQLS
jgi:hypothetical protein